MGMSTQTSDIPTPHPDDPLFPWFCPKPTVRILFYTDDPEVNLRHNVEDYDFGVRILRDLIVSHGADTAHFHITLLEREHAAPNAATQLTPEVLAGYDRVWFFGTALANRPHQPNNELTDAEVSH
jgi:hypothetical protein